MARIGIDLDGVCYDFSAAFCDVYEWRKPVKTWAFYEDYAVDVLEFLEMCRRAVRDGGLFRSGYIIPGARRGIQALLLAGHEIFFVTDRMSLSQGDKVIEKNILANTQYWLQNDLDLVLSRISPVVFDGDKAKVAKELELDYFLDDKAENYEDLIGAGVKVWLFDQPWNQQAGHAARVLNWPQFVKVIQSNENDKIESVERLRKTMLSGGMIDTMKLPPGEVRVTSETGGQKGQKPARMGSLDPWALLQVAEVAGFGEAKYARLNYMKGYEWHLNYDAMQRHLGLFWSGQDLDEESGLPHLAHAAWHCLALLAFMHHGLGTDTRYRKEAS